MSDITHVLQGWSRGELRVQRCDACGAKQFPPRAVCLACRSVALDWITIPAQGKIVTFTVVHRAPTPAWKARVPYVIALIDCAPGVRMMMNVEATDPEALAIGDSVDIDFAATDYDPQLRPFAYVAVV